MQHLTFDTDVFETKVVCWVAVVEEHLRYWQSGVPHHINDSDFVFDLDFFNCFSTNCGAKSTIIPLSEAKRLTWLL